MPAISITRIIRSEGRSSTAAEDAVVQEEPLEIRVSYPSINGDITRNISVTMRTPGNDADLALGFLFTEGIISSYADVASVTQTAENVILVALCIDISDRVRSLERNFYTTSSCGVCGKASIDAINVACPAQDGYPYDDLLVNAGVLYTLPDALRNRQSLFDQTGGIHACALFDSTGTLLDVYEDVGRHNAMDKLVGRLLKNGEVPAGRHVLLLSGRASFELLQKAAMAGINMVAAIGAPSSLAVQVAEERNMTLIGFLRGNKCNIYSGAQRILI